MIGIVLVSHSKKLADGLAELALQMAPTVPIVAAGGMDDGSLGTSFDRITQAVAEADRGAGVIILYDLGSALMTAELVRDTSETDTEIRIVDAPLVEGAIAAASEAAGGANLDVVETAALRAGGTETLTGADQTLLPDSTHRQLRLVNPLGLHARSAAMFVRSIDGLNAEVSVGRIGSERRTTARSVLGLVALRAVGGDVLDVTASGPDSARALDALEACVQSGFGEI